MHLKSDRLANITSCIFHTPVCTKRVFAHEICAAFVVAMRSENSRCLHVARVARVCNIVIHILRSIIMGSSCWARTIRSACMHGCAVCPLQSTLNVRVRRCIIIYTGRTRMMGSSVCNAKCGFVQNKHTHTTGTCAIYIIDRSLLARPQTKRVHHDHPIHPSILRRRHAR